MAQACAKAWFRQSNPRCEGWGHGERTAVHLLLNTIQARVGRATVQAAKTQEAPVHVSEWGRSQKGRSAHRGISIVGMTLHLSRD